MCFIYMIIIMAPSRILGWGNNMCQGQLRRQKKKKFYYKIWKDLETDGLDLIVP